MATSRPPSLNYLGSDAWDEGGRSVSTQFWSCNRPSSRIGFLALRDDCSQPEVISRYLSGYLFTIF